MKPITYGPRDSLYVDITILQVSYISPQDILNRERAQDHDETYYLWAMRFFMEFCRHHSKQIELVRSGS